jgi:hypothetical protein
MLVMRRSTALALIVALVLITVGVNVYQRMWGRDRFQEMREQLGTNANPPAAPATPGPGRNP